MVAEKNDTDKMVLDKMVLDKMVYGQNGSKFLYRFLFN